MDPEKMTVTITSSAGEEIPLTVTDAMSQILDFFELLGEAGGEDGSSVVWQLVDVSMKSPLLVTAQAVSVRPGVQAEVIAQREKALVSYSLDQIISSEPLPDWINARAKEKTISLLRRNMDGISRTDFQFYDRSPPRTIVRPIAEVAIEALQKTETRAANISRASWAEIGSIEGNVISTTSYYGRPAILIREQLTGKPIICVASDSAIQAGAERTWAETWKHQRVLVSGEISYGSDGYMNRVTLANFEMIEPSSSLKFEDIADPNFTGGLSASEYLETQWTEDLG